MHQDKKDRMHRGGGGGGRQCIGGKKENASGNDAGSESCTFRNS